MSKKSNSLQSAILKRANRGLPPTRWQRMCLHLQALLRHPGQLNHRSVYFQLKGMMRTLTEPEKKTTEPARPKTKRAKKSKKS